ncbi:hypothetical protein K1W54_02440 [Micromonospora sp. CPCC 205371]|nr:hypothetical protein [Micromonospora sp. CPCC 205371]
MAMAAVSGLIALGVSMLAPTPAQAGTGGWDLTGTNGDRAGAWAHGWVWWEGGRLHVSVHVEDTVANSRDARVHLTAFYLNGDTREETVVNSGGEGSVQSREFNFRSDVFAISGRECIDSSTTTESCAPGWGDVF